MKKIGVIGLLILLNIILVVGGVFGDNLPRDNCLYPCFKQGADCVCPPFERYSNCNTNALGITYVKTDYEISEDVLVSGNKCLNGRETKLYCGKPVGLGLDCKEKVLEYLKKNLNNDEFVVVEQTDNEKIIYLLTVAQEDMGKVIGKQGRIIRALRDLVKLMAAKEHMYVDIVLKEDEVV